MKLLHRQILRMLPGPLLGWLGTLLFLLLMQFLIRYLPDLVGKGLPFSVIVELISYNLAYMLVLALPMSVLIAALITFGRLAETNAYLVIKSAGVSLPRLLWPALLAGLLLTAFMGYFNNEVLPEANFRAKNLWQDIHRKKPGFQLQPGVFYEGLNNYSILVQERPAESGDLHDVLIYDYTGGTKQQAVIKAERGRIEPAGDGSVINFILYDGEVHRRPSAASVTSLEERYERLAFDRFRLRLDLSDFAFERTDPRQGYRSDRTMRTADMIRLVDSLEADVAESRARLVQSTRTLGRDTTTVSDAPAILPSVPVTQQQSTAPPIAARVALQGLSHTEQQRIYSRALQVVRTQRADIEEAQRTISWQEQRAASNRVEIHKKYSIAMACLIFMLIGAPLGLSIRRGGMGMAGAVALGIFLFYWVTLVQGEKLADRGLLAPWVGMWIANLVMIIAGLWLLLYASLDLRTTMPLRGRLRRFFKRSTFKVPQ